MRKSSNTFLGLSILLPSLLVTSCKISKDVALPDMAVPGNYRDAVTDTSSIALLPYQDLFEDTTLKALIKDALAHNNDVLVALKNIESAELTLKQAKLGNLPSLDIQATAVSNRPSDNSLNGLTLGQFLGSKHIEDYSIAASLSWEADIWGKIKAQKAGALADHLNSKEVVKAIQTRIVNDISKGYYDLLMLDTQLSIARHNVLLNDSTLNIIKLQYNSGQVTSLAVQQALAQKLSASVYIPNFEQQIEVQENAISVLSGRLPGAIKRGGDLDSENIYKYSTGLPVILLSIRPDVRQAELALSKANANVGYAKANMYPSLTISAQGGLDAIKASNWFNIPTSLFGAVAGGLTQPLFNKRKLSTQYDIARIERDRSVILFRQSVLTAYQEVSDALVKLNKLQDQQVLAQERTITLQLATRNSQLLFSNGLATYLEVITAQGNVLRSELELAAIKTARLNASVDLYRSLGGGWAVPN